MLKWNYRVIKDENTYGIYEVYYDKNENIKMFAEVAELTDEDFEGLRGTINAMADAFGRPVLKFKDII